jgi:hypothetical protein
MCFEAFSSLISTGYNFPVPRSSSTFTDASNRLLLTDDHPPSFHTDPPTLSAQVSTFDQRPECPSISLAPKPSAKFPCRKMITRARVLG